MAMKTPAKASARILVMDGDPHLLRESTNALYVFGFEVAAHGSIVSSRDPVASAVIGESAIDPYHEAVGGDYDVVVVDTNMQGLDLFHLMNTLQATDAKPVIILTAYEPQREVVISALKGGAFEFLLKPFSTDRLIEAIHQGLDNRRAFFQILNLSKQLEEANHACSLERDQLAVSNQTLRRLTECVQQVSAALTTEELVQALTASFPSIVAYDRICLSIFQENARWVHIPGVAAEGALTCHPLTTPDHTEDIEGQGMSAVPQPAHGGHHTDVSLHVLDHHIGFMSLERSDTHHAFSLQERDLLAMVGNSVSLAIRNVEAHRRVQTLAVTDGLTGLLNHRAFSSILSREFIKTKRYQKPLCLLMIDVDYFKVINDRWGHQAGDKALTEFARLCSEVVRDVDIVARYGGDEFAVILPDTEFRQALTVAERIQDAVHAQQSVDGKSYELAPAEPGALPELAVTVSIGVASSPHPLISSSDDLISEADKALYAAKEGGRDRIEMIEGECASLRIRDPDDVACMEAAS